MDTDPIADHVVALTNELNELAEQMQTLVEELVQERPPVPWSGRT